MNQSLLVMFGHPGSQNVLGMFVLFRFHLILTLPVTEEVHWQDRDSRREDIGIPSGCGEEGKRRFLGCQKVFVGESQLTDTSAVVETAGPRGGQRKRDEMKLIKRRQWWWEEMFSAITEPLLLFFCLLEQESWARRITSVQNYIENMHPEQGAPTGSAPAGSTSQVNVSHVG